MNKQKFIWLLVAAFLMASIMPVMAAGTPAPDEICGGKVGYKLWGGKDIPVGAVTVYNTEDTLYVQYNTFGDWYLEETHLYVLDYEPTERLTPGHAPYKSGDIAYTQSWSFAVPLGDIECGTTIWLQAHAAVAKIVDGEKVQGETAYGGDINPDANPWYGNIKYEVQCCEDDELCEEFKDETAWAAGSRYTPRGNWATFTPYVPDSSVTLFAGQHHAAGTVDFSAPDNGWVTITINLTGDWEFAPTAENVKIQDYDVAPSGNPAPGLFAHKGDASGQSFSIQVPENNFYGVHADVGYWMEVTCPVE